MTELHHFHPARKGSGSLRPFPIYPLYTQAEILSLDKPIADCFLFRPRKSCERRRKCSHTNVSNTLVARPSTPPAQTPHTPKQGPSGQGRYHYPRSVPHVHKHPRAGYQNGVLCRFWVLVGGAPKERREPRDSDALMRVAVPRRRGPAGLRRPTPPAERTVLAPISPRVQLCLRRPAFPLSAFIPGA